MKSAIYEKKKSSENDFFMIFTFSLLNSNKKSLAYSQRTAACTDLISYIKNCISNVRKKCILRDNNYLFRKKNGSLTKNKFLLQNAYFLDDFLSFLLFYPISFRIHFTKGIQYVRKILKNKISLETQKNHIL